MIVHVRPARPLDAGAMGAILQDFASDTDWMPVLHSGAEAVAFCGRMIDMGWVRVAGTPTSVQGFLARRGHEVHALYVASGARGQGIGRRLLDDAKDSADRLELWTFQANLGAQRFYRREGFAEICRTDGTGNDEGLPDIRLGWQAAVARKGQS
ncbi:MAG: N-acetyltransferase family protein [Marinibacterium sp.]